MFDFFCITTLDNYDTKVKFTLNMILYEKFFNCLI